ncbi:glycosyltransferase family 61 protein [Acetobacter estunensis]|uniref:glycosyltransferase family 61 protein n=1 Tax=Acetobacter estunensis TaxID=104097 RepID=UPI001C2D2F4E|nr:glycosyltransferase family 61 protein [Acetobacter estunensis]MBV1835841.1 glycosyltransferase family 61 protein [Acetobacter estunensis]MBV1835898.1 glycosyltransferase family 61 protein [Acetobacter estunensis]
MKYQQANTDLFGLKVIDEEPETNIYRNILYIPRSKLNTDKDVEYGIYDQFGRLITNASTRRGWPNHSVGQSTSSCINPLGDHNRAEDYIYFYGGHISNHFGHFITETLPRFWCQPHIYQNKKILIHSAFDLNYLFSLAWVKKFFPF